MKKLILIAFIMLTQLNFGQTTIQLGDFDEIRIFDQLYVILIPSNENKLVISEENKDKVETVNKKGVLKIRTAVNNTLSGSGIKATLYFKNIKTIDANEGCIVICNTIFKQTSIVLSSQEGAMIEVDLDVENVTSKLYSGGIINLGGKAFIQKVTINTGGIFNAKNLETSQTTVSLSAGGSANVNASTLVNAKVNAGGNIYIYGKPKEINQQTFAGGTITEKE